MRRMNNLWHFNFQVLLLINWFTAIQCTMCGLTLQQDTSAYTVSENSPSIYIPYSCKLLFQELITMNIAPRIIVE